MMMSCMRGVPFRANTRKVSSGAFECAATAAQVSSDELFKTNVILEAERERVSIAISALASEPPVDPEIIGESHEDKNHIIISLREQLIKSRVKTEKLRSDMAGGIESVVVHSAVIESMRIDLREEKARRAVAERE